MITLPEIRDVLFLMVESSCLVGAQWLSKYYHELYHLHISYRFIDKRKELESLTPIGS